MEIEVRIVYEKPYRMGGFIFGGYHVQRIIDGRCEASGFKTKGDAIDFTKEQKVYPKMIVVEESK